MVTYLFVPQFIMSVTVLNVWMLTYAVNIWSTNSRNQSNPKVVENQSLSSQRRNGSSSVQELIYGDVAEYFYMRKAL